MDENKRLTSVDTHYEFGKNWQDYSRVITEAELECSIRSLNQMLGSVGVENKSILDIGCGSGLHAIAMIRLGAQHVSGVDIDVNSVATAREVCRKFDLETKADFEQASVFELPSRHQSAYDIVYSWGVLHHTGSMWKALDCALACVKPGGYFAFALYERTSLCGFWRMEKRTYTALPRILRYPLEWLYMTAHFIYLLLCTRRWPLNVYAEYRHTRGMRFYYDVRDWLGGYPYESVSPAEVIAFARRNDLEVISAPEANKPMPRGLLGSGCLEFVLRKRANG